MFKTNILITHIYKLVSTHLAYRQPYLYATDAQKYGRYHFPLLRMDQKPIDRHYNYNYNYYK